MITINQGYHVQPQVLLLKVIIVAIAPNQYPTVKPRYKPCIPLIRSILLARTPPSYRPFVACPVGLLIS